MFPEGNALGECKSSISPYRYSQKLLASESLSISPRLVVFAVIAGAVLWCVNLFDDFLARAYSISQRRHTFLSALLTQICDQSGALSDSLSDSYSANHHGSWCLCAQQQRASTIQRLIHIPGLLEEAPVLAFHIRRMGVQVQLQLTCHHHVMTS